MEEGILIDAETAVPLGIVVTELVTNAVKYAFPAPRSGTIRAEGRRVSPDRIEVVIHDDGVGVSTMREGSLGYGLVRSLVGQIGGEMDMTTDPDGDALLPRRVVRFGRLGGPQPREGEEAHSTFDACIRSITPS
jgi:two-component sensor histidine kinase